MKIRTGDRMPDGTLYELAQGAPRAVPASTLFTGSRVALFSCPGAFTTKSSERQLPGYVARRDSFRDLGVEAVVCISINDPWVMDAWSRHVDPAGRVRMLADPDCSYHRALGLEMDCLRMTLGWRSHRFAILAEQSVVVELNVEAPGAYEVSDAAVLHRQLQGRQGVVSQDGAA